MNSELTRYYFNHAMRTTPIANPGGDADSLLCTVPGARQQLSMRRKTLNLLRLFDGTRTIPEVLSAYREHYGTPSWTLPELERFIAESCLPTKLLLTKAEDAPTAVDGRIGSNYLFMRQSVMSPRLVKILVRPLCWLFTRFIAVVVMAIVLLCHFVVYWFFGWHILTVPGFRDAFEGLGLFAISIFLHELGHAAALIRYGCQDADIGVGLYLYIPVVYTNASDAWHLAQRQRVVVDLAGIYFQQIFAAALTVFFLSAGTECCGYAVAMIDGSMLLTLNPFLRMDGYWLLSDVCRLQNLRKQSISAIQRLMSRLGWRSHQAIGEVHTLTKPQQVVVTLYAVLSIVFSIYLLVIVLRCAVDTSTTYGALLARTMAVMEDSSKSYERWVAAMALIKSTGELGCWSLCGICIVRNVWNRVRPEKVRPSPQ